MACKICKRDNCVSAFHSIAEQEAFERGNNPRVVRIEVRGGVAEVVEQPSDVDVFIDDLDNH